MPHDAQYEISFFRHISDRILRRIRKLSKKMERLRSVLDRRMSEQSCLVLCVTHMAVLSEKAFSHNPDMRVVSLSRRFVSRLRVLSSSLVNGDLESITDKDLVSPILLTHSRLFKAAMQSRQRIDLDPALLENLKLAAISVLGNEI